MKNNYTIEFKSIDHTWTIKRADMEKLWEEMTEQIPSSWENDERLPYWAELWPSSLAMAKWLKSQEEIIRGRSCLDMGCGLGFTSLCAAHLGAYVLGVDYEEAAITLACENAELNQISLRTWEEMQSLNFTQSEAHKGSVDFRCMDWRRPCIASKSVDILFASDIVYEKAFIEPVLNFLEYSLAEQGICWIAEPSRSIFNYFLQAIEKYSFSMIEVYNERTEALSAHIPSAQVRIWEIRRK